jgi:hypothetical protein
VRVISYFSTIAFISATFSCQIPKDEFAPPVEIFANQPELTPGFTLIPQDFHGKLFPKNSS